MIGSTKTDPNAAWQNMRRLYSAYLALSREFAIETQPCAALESEVGVPSAEGTTRAEQWLTDMDQRVQIHQLRQFVQTSAQADEAFLHALLSCYLRKEKHSEQDRDKVDFLLVQIFSQAAPSDISGPSLSLTEAAKILQPVLGIVEISAADWLDPLEDLLGKAYRAKNLNELFTSRIIEQGRQIKASSNDKFFEPSSLVAFARFGFLVRRAFFRLMHQDLNTILDGLRDLEAQGVTTLDCRKAQFAADEPVSRLRMICQSWKVMFHAEYSSGQPLCILVDLRTAVESALMHAARRGAPKAKAAAAGSAQEFEVSGSSWGGNDDAEQ
jgi:hypothetical protein